MSLEEKSTIASCLYLFLILSFFSTILLIADRLTRLGWLHAGAEKSINPAKQVVTQSVRWMGVLGKQSLDNPDPMILQAKIDYLQAQIARLELEGKSIQDENEAFKKQLGAPRGKTKNLIPAKNLSVLDGVMTVDRGERDGVRQGQIVVSGDILVGRVISVSVFGAKVLLPNAPDNKISVKILPSWEKGILRGTQEGRIMLEEVLQKADLRIDQVVATDGRDGVYPSDLPIGKIENVIKDDAAIYKKAQVKPLVDYSTLPVVMIAF